MKVVDMKVVAIVLDKQLLQAADRAARRLRSSRSAVVRNALREHLCRLEIRAREERDRAGYAQVPAGVPKWALNKPPTAYGLAEQAGIMGPAKNPRNT